jgi:pantoate--beta-alanine ligase
MTPRLRLVRGLEPLREALGQLRCSRQRLALVPTMGALHDGHLFLVRRALEEADGVVVSIFVNPIQFGPGEDLDRYPRQLDEDAALLDAAGADLLFTVSAEEMYPPGYASYVTVEGPPAVGLCAASRPGHFRGVATVVLKLLHLVRPDVAVFGQKDLQQARVLARMVQDLDLEVHVVVAPTVREPDGLALSSRNTYLSADERREALALSRGLQEARAALAQGVREVSALLEVVRDASAGSPAVEWEYIEVVDAESLVPLEGSVRFPLALLCAARVGPARLIDNILVEEPPGA